MSDTISRAMAIREYQEVCKGIKCGECPLLIKVNTEKGSHLITDCKLEAFLHDLPSAQPESCEDTVSRQRLLNDLKELITAWKKYPVMAKQIKGVEAAIEYVKAIPSADRPKGEWVFDTQIPISGGGSSAGYRCSICGRDYFHVDGMNFCPNCGSYNGGWQSD